MISFDPIQRAFTIFSLIVFLIAAVFARSALADIPAAPVLTLYKFNSEPNVPYYSVASLLRDVRNPVPAGSLAQGTSVIPCVIVHDGSALTDPSGTPFVGFEIVVDSRKAGPESTEAFKQAVARQKLARVQNHHCSPSVEYAIDVRAWYGLNKAPFFDPPPASSAGIAVESRGKLDEIIRAFHASTDCRDANRLLIGRRQALNGAWESFMRANRSRWTQSELERAKHLDYVMRTAIYESHLDRGCNAYAACERNIVALSIRNRALENCAAGQGCDYPGDFQGVSSKVSQYNIWDEYLTQITGLTSCFLAPYANNAYYEKIQTIYGQNVQDVEKILFGDDSRLTSVFSSSPVSHLKGLRHYYHAPAMGKCFPDHPRVEYMTGAIAQRGTDFALIANKRIQVDDRVGQGYLFHEFVLKEEMYHDNISIEDNYPGFLIDARKVELRAAGGCAPYGIPRGCAFDRIERYRKTPSWLGSGNPMELSCKVEDFGESCEASGRVTSVSVGGSCDTQMRPVRDVP